MLEKKAITEAPIHDILARRWSGRSFDPNRSISFEKIMALCEAARWAPSCFGDEPWKFIVWDKTTNPRPWLKAFLCLAELNQKWVKNSTLLIGAFADTVFTQNNKPNRWAQFDTGAACLSICLQATAMGLMAHQMGGFDANTLKKEFEIPERYTPMSMIAVGYYADLELLHDDDLKEKELASRHRHSIERIFFDGEWGKPIVVEME